MSSNRFYIPIFGMIWLLVFRKDESLSVKLLGIGALIGFLIGFFSILGI